jgi:1-acyl-sn-glycerol-3-phosphate acyltransferase
MLRVIWVMTAFVAATAALAAWILILRTLHLPGVDRASLCYSRAMCALLRVRVSVQGTPPQGAVLVVSNHASWLDIIVISAHAPTMFVAKREVSRWPLIGAVARLRGTIFVDRERRHQSAAANAEIAQRLTEEQPVVLFAEGTSSDGNRVLPFRSALFGAVKDAVMAPRAGVSQSICVQPLAITYTHLNGLPMGRRMRPAVAWYGDVDFVPHLKQFVQSGAVDAVLAWGEGRAYDGAVNRKVLMAALETSVRDLHVRTLQGRLPGHSISA